MDGACHGMREMLDGQAGARREMHIGNFSGLKKDDCDGL